MRWLSRVAIGTVAVAIVAVIATDRPELVHAPSLSLSRTLAFPNVPVELTARGFLPNELVQVDVTDPTGSSTVVGAPLAGPDGGVTGVLTSSEYGTNGVNLVRLRGKRSAASVASELTLLG